MSRKIVASDAARRVREVHGLTVMLDESTFVKASSLARYIDRDYGEWWALLKTVLRGSRHTDFKYVNFKKSRIISHDQFCEKLMKAHHGIIHLRSDQIYVSSHSKLVFIDVEFGEWTTMPYSVLAGHGHPNRGQHNRASHSRRSTFMKHWKTDRDLICTASYEVAVVRWLNKQRLDFDWQIPVITPHGTYYVDLYIKEGKYANIWIEIKGTWDRKNGHISKAKWEWFNHKFSNSELWMKPELVKLGIL